MTKHIRIGILRVISQTKELTDAHGKLIEGKYKHIKCVSKCISNQPNGIYDDKSKALALPKIISTAKEFLNLDIDGLLISCADDPGLFEVRNSLKASGIPVVGAGESTALKAKAIGGNVHALGITTSPPASFVNILGTSLVGYTQPVGVRTTKDLQAKEGVQSALQAAIEIESSGADILALACTGFASTGLANKIEDEVGIIVLNPINCAVQDLLQKIR